MRRQDHGRPKPDPRSPVQPGDSAVPYFIAAVVAAIAFWAFQQIRVQDWGVRRPLPVQERAKGSVLGVFSDEDYPMGAAARDEQGTVQAELRIDKQGRVSRCTIIRSSGHESLDSATCTILRRRARFTPARDVGGKATPDTVVTPPIVWRLED